MIDFPEREDRSAYFLHLLEAIAMAEAVKYKKEYIEVEVHFAADGTMLPRVIEALCKTKD